MSGFAVQPESFAPVARHLRSAGEQLANQWAPIRAQSTAVGFGRGDDVLSPLIHVSLEGAVSLVDDCLSSCAEALAAFADGLELMGRTYRDTDAAAVGSFDAGAGS